MRARGSITRQLTQLNGPLAMAGRQLRARMQARATTDTVLAGNPKPISPTPEPVPQPTFPPAPIPEPLPDPVEDSRSV